MRPFRSPTPLVAALLLLVTAPALHAQAKPKPGTLGPARPAPMPPTRPASTPAPAAGARAPIDSTRPMTLRGIIWDSTANQPLAGATVQLAPAEDRSQSFNATTGADGRWELRGVKPGRYVAGYFHPTVDVLGLEAPVVLVNLLPDTAARLDFGIPGPSNLRDLVCPNVPPDRAVLVGQVRDAETGDAVADAKVVVTWKELRIGEDGVRNVQRRLPVKVRPDGGFRICDLPAETELVANAEAPKRRAGLLELRLDKRELLRRDFALADTGSVQIVVIPDTMAAREGRLEQPTTVVRGRAALSGTVRGSDGRPLQGARVQVWGTDVGGTTNESGSFSLSGLPSGTYALEVRAIGYAPKRVPVDLTARRPATVAVALDNRVNTLQSVVVQADRTKLEKDYTGFLERQKRGMGGRFFSEDDIAKRSPIVVSDVLRMAPGIRVMPNGTGFGYSIQGRGQCTPDVFIDGMRVFGGADDLDQLVRPTDVGGIEVYNGGGTTPVQFQSPGGGGCGAVVIWTKRGGK